jgi:tRNA (cmo5U34)-methyltransferase
MAVHRRLLVDGLPLTPVDGVYDQPSTIADQVRWLVAAGFHARVVWARQDLCVIVADSLS